MTQASGIAIAASMAPVSIWVQPGTASALLDRRRIIAIAAGTLTIQPAANSLARVTAVIEQGAQTAGIKFAGQSIERRSGLRCVLSDHALVYCIAGSQTADTRRRCTPVLCVCKALERNILTR